MPGSLYPVGGDGAFGGLGGLLIPPHPHVGARNDVPTPLLHMWPGSMCASPLASSRGGIKVRTTADSLGRIDIWDHPGDLSGGSASITESRVVGRDNRPVRRADRRAVSGISSIMDAAPHPGQRSTPDAAGAPSGLFRLRLRIRFAGLQSLSVIDACLLPTKQS